MKTENYLKTHDGFELKIGDNFYVVRNGDLEYYGSDDSNISFKVDKNTSLDVNEFAKYFKYKENALKYISGEDNGNYTSLSDSISNLKEVAKQNGFKVKIIFE